MLVQVESNYHCCLNLCDKWCDVIIYWMQVNVLCTMHVLLPVIEAYAWLSRFVSLVR